MLDRFIDGYTRTYLFALKEIDQAIEEVEIDGKRISTEQFFVLRELQRTGVGISATALSNRLNVNKSAITAKIKNLTEKGFLLRTTNKEDKRAVILEMSASGLEIFKECEQAMKSLINRWLSTFGKENSEKLMTLYDQLVETVIDLETQGGSH
ncbi:MarR family winged helix-turn-helix transcriptional regulator [Listeria valentina]|uniref:MarR family winged helix-turn-helix transcriptional regulator n=1 Tax=Listeria valentina TaxID=2705293 RepID=UPI001FEC9C4B|nr:MarR family transcriptional regulator [Listeria valentina]